MINMGTMLILVVAEAPGICPPRTLGTPYRSIEYSGRQNVLFKPESVKFMLFDNQLAYCKLV